MIKTSSSLWIVIALAVGCSGSPKTSTVEQPEGSGGGTGEGSDVVETEGPTYGEDCGVDDHCAIGLECVHYYGFAGASGPEFRTCEVRCDDKAQACPDGLTCATIADGPGAVCRSSI